MPSIRIPAEWARHEACWTAWPYRDEWGKNLTAARAEVADLVCAIAGAGERVALLVPQDRTGLADWPSGVHEHLFEYGDIWLRDIGPVLGTDRGRLCATKFRFNGWGGKYEFPEDQLVATAIARHVRATEREFALVCEGGAVETDGAGTLLTTRDCLLSDNRNPGLSEEEVGELLKRAYGADKVLWLSGALLNDHTDGHIDTLCRFVAEGTVACMVPEKGDPNAETLSRLRDELSSLTDAKGSPLEVVEIPSPGRVVDPDGDLLPASYLNFYIANEAVIVPTYNADADQEAVARVGSLFPNHRTLGLSARALLTGGGAFHCITQQQPQLGDPA